MVFLRGPFFCSRNLGRPVFWPLSSWGDLCKMVVIRVLFLGRLTLWKSHYIRYISSPLQVLLMEVNWPLIVKTTLEARGNIRPFMMGQVVPLGPIQHQRPNGAKMAPNQVVPIWHIGRQRPDGAKVALAITTLTTSMTDIAWHLMTFVPYRHYLVLDVPSQFFLLFSPGIRRVNYGVRILHLSSAHKLIFLVLGERREPKFWDLKTQIAQISDAIVDPISTLQGCGNGCHYIRIGLTSYAGRWRSMSDYFCKIKKASPKITKGRWKYEGGPIST